MKRYSQLPWIKPAFLIVILTLNITGCYTFKPVPSSDLPLYQTEKYNFVIKGKGIPFLLENPKLSKGLLWGTANPDAIVTKNKMIRIYPVPDYELRIADSLNTFVIPIDRIAKIKKSEFSSLHSLELLSFLMLIF